MKLIPFLQERKTFFLLLILVLAFLVRLYRIDNPLGDWHSWRQADTSAVSRNFIKSGYDILHPRYDDISNVQTGFDNPEGYRFVEFPIFNIFQAALSQIFNFLTLEEWGRMVSIFATLFSIFFIYKLVAKYATIQAGLFSAFFYGFFPYTIYYGRTILPDTSMVAAVLGGIYFFDLYLDGKNSKNWINYIFSMILISVSLLLKPYAIFFVLPIVYLVWKKFGFKFWKHWELWIFALISVAPLAFWRVWISHYPQGVPANIWLLNGNGIRFRPAFFRWIFYERLTKLISGYFGISLLLLSFVAIRTWKNALFFYSFLLSSLLYVVIFATGNVQHDYYQILIMPTVSIFAGLGMYVLINNKNKLFSVLAVLIVCLSFYFSWQQVKDYFNINNRSIFEVGKVADALLPKDALVIAPLDGDTTLLYAINRKGWPAFEKSTEDLKKMGAGYLIFVNPTNEERKTPYRAIADSKDYVIYDLNQHL